MKKFFRTRVVNMLSNLSRRTLSKYDPVVIAVTGNIGKTTTKDYIYSFLNTKNSQNQEDFVRASQKSENSEFGMNLTILGEKNPWNSATGWIKIILRNFINLYRTKKYPKVLVLEVGADKPGDIKFLTSIIKPDLVVLTAFQETPTHGEFFSSVEQHINEKKYLVERMKKDGVIVYNADDEVMSKIAEEKKLKSPKIEIFSFGQETDANISILENTNLYNEEADIIGTKIKLGINFKNFSDEIELRILDVVGEAQAYSVAAAVCVAILNNFKKEDLLNVVRNFERNFILSKSRMRILQGVLDSTIIDDSYNSSPKASLNAIETVSKILSKGKKIAVLGHMAELGEKTKQEHIKVAELAAKVFDIIIFSGRYNEFYLEGVRNAKTDLSKVFLTKDSNDVLKIMSENDLIRENDLILIKGSQSARLEKVVVELLVNPRDREEVCRQDKEWVNR
jgi:UDP-N-acetylmuramoyl-tripeptide--D-alanyl-D-alanine ligase